MRITLRHLTLLVAAGAVVGAVGLAPPAHAGTDGMDCLDAGTVLCQAPTRAPTSSGGPDPAVQQMIGGNMLNPTPPLAAFG